MNNVKNKVILITGASSGIGKETVKELLKHEAIVYAAARRVEKMQDLAELGAKVLKMDVTNEDSMVAAIDQINKNDGGVDILINNAGYAIYGAVEDTSIEDARRQFEVNIFGLARVTQLVLPHMRDNKSGKIVNISSVGGKIYTPLGAWYHATKHALEGWSDSLRLELKQFGIDVIIIEPGGIKTEFGDVMYQPMLDRSGDTAYGELAQQVAKVTKDTYESSKISPPNVISKLISKAVNARNPKTRYHAGYLSGPVLFLRKWTSDKRFDKIMTSQLK